MSDFVHKQGEYIYDPSEDTVTTRLYFTDACGNLQLKQEFVTTASIFLWWCGKMDATRHAILEHRAREVVASLPRRRLKAG